nr:tau-tubulin kinase homolog Asator-like [Penaeus vannamei]
MAASRPAIKTLSQQDVKDLLQDPSLRLLGSGASAKVYSVRYEGRTRALKVAHSPDIDVSSELVFLSSINGAGGAPVPLAVGTDPDALLMTFCGKRTLGDYVRRGPKSGAFSLLHLLTLAMRVTERLQELHRAGFVHCDLKANNVTVRLDSGRNVKSVHLIDFGLSVRIGTRLAPRKKRHNKQWYCDCRYNGSALQPSCDLPGLATVFATLFGDRDIP